MKKRLEKIDYSKLTDVEIWKLVKNQKIKTFPKNFWTKHSFKNILRYICLEIYNFSREDLCNTNFRKLFKNEYIFSGLKCFDYTIYNTIAYCFPEFEIKQWETLATSNDFWNDDTVKEAINWVCDKENILTKQDVINKFSKILLKKYKLTTICMKYSLQQLLDMCFSNYGIKVWELKKVGKWTDDLAHQAIRWVLEKENLKTKEDICEKFSGHLLVRNGLKGMLNRKFNYITIDVLEFEFPGQFKKEELKAYRNHI